jgi:hypothetical protein
MIGGTGGPPRAAARRVAARRARWPWASLAYLGVASLAACGDTGAGSPDSGEVDGGADLGAADLGVVPPVDPRVIPAANALPPTDPRFEGQQRFLWDTFDTERVADWPPAEFFLRLMRDEPEVFGDQFARFGFVRDPDDDLPVGFKRGTSDPSRVRETCALCHVGELPDGRLWIGAPNLRLDFGRFTVEVSRRWAAEGNPPLVDARAEEKLLALGPGRTDAASSDYPRAVPADFPPYFSLGERAHLNYLGTGLDARSEIYLSVFSAGAGRPAPDGSIPVPFPPPARIDPFVAFLSSIEPPRGPAQDAALVTRGARVFEEARCSACHHPGAESMDRVVTYDRAPDGRERYPGEDAAFPRGSIRTSYPHRLLVDGDPDAGMSADEGRADLIRFIARNRLRVEPSDGYRVGFLRGIWASPPYLHNGSVPTLEDLLKPAAERPASFSREGFEVDTTRFGNSNQGHEFGVDLGPEDATALLAYLRSL